jgi:hypothetical protein
MFCAFLLLFCLTALSAIASVSVAVRAGISGRAEIIVAATVLWNGLILLPIYGLGWAHKLDATNLACASILVSITALALSWPRSDRGSYPRQLAQCLRGLVRFPVDALMASARPVSFVLVALLATGALIAWTAVAAYYAPSARMYDCLWYHEPIIGFTIQNRGFEIVSLPDTLERINGLPRVAEMTQLWFVIFTDRRLIELAPSLLSPALVACEYLLCLRYAKDRIVALGWACAFFLTPTFIYELDSTLVDNHLTFVTLAALWFATKKDFRLGDSLLAAVALTLTVGIKYQALVPVASIALIALVRTWLIRGPKILAKAAVSLIGTAAISIMAASTYGRNYLVFKNPFWPFLLPGRPQWPGYAEPGQNLQKPGVDINVPFESTVKSLLSVSDAAFQYGTGFVWIILPLLALATAVFVLHLVACARRGGRAHPSDVESDWRSLAAVALTFVPAALVVWTSPALNQARYHGFVIGAIIAFIAWTAGHSRLGGLAREGAVAVVCVMSFMGYYTAEPSYIWKPSEILALAKLPYPEREVTPKLSVFVAHNVGLERERELGKDDIVAFGRNYGAFPALFFNNRHSNRIVYLANAETFVKDAEAIGAKWVFCVPGDPCYGTLSASSTWAPVGILHRETRGQVFHRFPVAQASGSRP